MLLKLSFEFFIFIVSMRVFGIFYKRGFIKGTPFLPKYLFVIFILVFLYFYFILTLVLKLINLRERSTIFSLFNVQDSSTY